MANAVATPTVTSSRMEAHYRVTGTIAVGADPLNYVAGGLVLNFFNAKVKATRVPLTVFVQGTGGYLYAYVAGTDGSNGKLIIRAQKASASDHDALTELADATAIPAGVSSDVITFEAIWKGML